MLFVIAVDVFDDVINKAHNLGYILGLGPSSKSWELSNVHFADDTLLFCKKFQFQLVALMIILYSFELVSGLKINSGKSSLIHLGQKNEDNNIYANIFNSKMEPFPIKYLGLPLRNKKLKKDDWFKVIDKVEYILNSWKSKHLSLGGRLTLVNSVISSIQSYFLSFFLFPAWVISKLDKINRGFF